MYVQIVVLTFDLHGGCTIRTKQQYQIKHHHYTLSHPENDREVTDRVREYTLQDASFMRQSRCSFLNV